MLEYTNAPLEKIRAYLKELRAQKDPYPEPAATVLFRRISAHRQFAHDLVRLANGLKRDAQRIEDNTNYLRRNVYRLIDDDMEYFSDDAIDIIRILNQHVESLKLFRNEYPKQ